MRSRQAAYLVQLEHMHIQKNKGASRRLSLPVAFIFSALIVSFASNQSASAETSTSTPPDPYTSAGVEVRVREYFKDIPVMIPIAKCESGFRQFDSNQQPLRGGTGSMIGVFQIGDEYHRLAAQELGLNIDTLSGNMAYARHLYERDGTDPWLSSFPCWNTGVAEAQTPPAPATPSPIVSAPIVGVLMLTENLSLGVISPEVQILQKILNANGYQLAASGPGSPGNETTKYGSLTRDAIRRFQCAQNITCTGDEGTTGYGFVGKRTRTALMNLGMGNGSGNGGGVPPVPPSPTPATDASMTKEAEIQSIQSQIDALMKQVTSLQEILKQKRGY